MVLEGFTYHTYEFIHCHILVKYHSQISHKGLVTNSFNSYLNGSDYWPSSILGAYNQLCFILLKLQLVISHPFVNIQDTAFNPRPEQACIYIRFGLKGYI